MQKIPFGKSKTHRWSIYWMELAEHLPFNKIPEKMKAHYLIVIGFLFLSCKEGTLLTDTIQNTNHIEIGKAKEVDTYVMMDFGEIVIGSGSEKLVTASFYYNFPGFGYYLNYEEDDNRGTLKVFQENKEKNWAFNKQGENLENRWEIALNDAIHYNLNVDLKAGRALVDIRNTQIKTLNIDCGAGEGSVYVGNSHLESMSLNSKVGKLWVDFTGDWNNSLDAKIEGSVGAIELIFPKEHHVEVICITKLGKVEAPDFKKLSDGYSYKSEKPQAKTIYVNVKTTIGKIDLQLK